MFASRSCLLVDLGVLGACAPSVSYAFCLLLLRTNVGCFPAATSAASAAPLLPLGDFRVVRLRLQVVHRANKPTSRTKAARDAAIIIPIIFS